MAMGTEQQVLLQHFGEQLVKQPKEKEKEKKGISAVFLIVKKRCENLSWFAYAMKTKN